MDFKQWAGRYGIDVENDVEFIVAKKLISINEVFSRRMKELGLSQRDMAKKLSVSQPYISKVLNSDTNVSLKTLVSFSLALGLELEPALKTRESDSDYEEVQPSRTLRASLDVHCHQQAGASFEGRSFYLIEGGQKSQKSRSKINEYPVSNAS